MAFKVQVYVHHGYYEYEVDTAERAVVHGQEIMARGVYRHCIPGGVEFHVPRYVRVRGEGLESQYKDTFRRT